MQDTIKVEFIPAKKWYRSPLWKLLEEYTSCNGNVTVPTGFITDGASIPKWAQRFIGEPLEGDTLRAVLVHDVYCENKKRSQEDTHKVFREILKLDGVNFLTRTLMYQAVTKYNKIKNPFWN